MTSATATYELRVAGHLDDHWSARLGDLTLTRNRDGTTTLTGPIADQAQLHGVLAAVRDLGCHPPVTAHARLRAEQPSTTARGRRSGARAPRCAPSGSRSAPPPRTTPTPPGGTGGSDSVGEWLTEVPTDLEAYRATFADPARLTTTVMVELDAVLIGDFMLRIEDAWAQTDVADRGHHTQASATMAHRDDGEPRGSHLEGSADQDPDHPGPLAQLAEQRTFNPRVVGSSPTGPTI